MKKITVLIADDHSIVRTGLTSLLSTKSDIEVIGEARNGNDAIEKTLRLKPNVLVMDLVMPKKNGVEAISEIAARLPSCKILVLTTFATSEEMSKALANGAQSALLKSASNAELVTAIRATASGKRVISHEISRMIAEDPPLPEISGRQLQILESISRGLHTGNCLAIQHQPGQRQDAHHATFGENRRCQPIGSRGDRHAEAPAQDLIWRRTADQKPGRFNWPETQTLRPLESVRSEVS